MIQLPLMPLEPISIATYWLLFASSLASRRKAIFVFAFSRLWCCVGVADDYVSAFATSPLRFDQRTLWETISSSRLLQLSICLSHPIDTLCDTHLLALRGIARIASTKNFSCSSASGVWIYLNIIYKNGIIIVIGVVIVFLTISDFKFHQKT